MRHQRIDSGKAPWKDWASKDQPWEDNPNWLQIDPIRVIELIKNSQGISQPGFPEATSYMRLDKLVHHSAGVTNGPHHQYLSIQRTRFAADEAKAAGAIKRMEEAEEHNPVCKEIKAVRLAELRAFHKVSKEAVEDVDKKLSRLYVEEIKREEREAHFTLNVFAAFLQSQLKPRHLPSDPTKITFFFFVSFGTTRIVLFRLIFLGNFS